MGEPNHRGFDLVPPASDAGGSRRLLPPPASRAVGLLAFTAATALAAGPVRAQGAPAAAIAPTSEPPALRPVACELAPLRSESPKLAAPARDADPCWGVGTGAEQASVDPPGSAVAALPPADSIAHRGLRVLAWEGRRVLDFVRLRRRVPDLAAMRLYHGAWLRPIGGDSVVFEFEPLLAVAHHTPGISVAYDPGSGASAWAGSFTNSPLRAGLEGAAARLLFELGRSLAPAAPFGAATGYRLGGDAVLRLGMAPTFFFGADGRDAPAADTRAVHASAGFLRRLGDGWEVSAGGEARLLRTPGLPDHGDAAAVVRVFGFRGPNPPLVAAEWAWNPWYHRVAVEAGPTLGLGAARFRPYIRVGWGDRLPFLSGFWLGGGEGFPGLKPGEGHGNRELLSGMALSRPIWGRLSTQVLVAAGRSADGGPLLGTDGWLAGARAGLGVDTPRLGLVRLEYGFATGGRRALFLRLGGLL